MISSTNSSKNATMILDQAMKIYQQDEDINDRYYQTRSDRKAFTNTQSVEMQLSQNHFNSRY